MKRLTTVVAVLVILGLVLPTFVFAQDEAVGGPRAARRGARMGAAEERPGGPESMRPRMGGAQQLQRIALLAARARDDAELQAMVDKCIQDRKTLLNLEEKQIGIFEELVAAIRAENKELAKTKSAELKAGREDIRAKATQLGKDIHAVAERLREIMPELGERAGRGMRGDPEMGGGARRGQNRGQGRVRGRLGGDRPAPDDMDELPLDIY